MTVDYVGWCLKQKLVIRSNNSKSPTRLSEASFRRMKPNWPIII